MEIKNSAVIIGIIALVAGLTGGYVVGANKSVPVAEEADGMHAAMDDMMGGLAGKTGDEMDKTFLDEMIVHHEGAVEMANMLLASTKRLELKEMGTNIISAQTEEIEMMQKWRSEWFGN